MWIKLLGICLVCVSCAGIGGGEALRLIGRRRFLEEVKRIATGLRGEIGYTQAVLPLALCRAGARGDGKAGKLFLVAGERLEANPECPFGRIWEAVLEEQGIRPMLGTEEWEMMCRFGNSIGYLDLEMQQKTLALYLEELERAIEQLRREEPEKKRLCWGTPVPPGPHRNHPLSGRNLHNRHMPLPAPVLSTCNSWNCSSGGRQRNHFPALRLLPRSV